MEEKREPNVDPGATERPRRPLRVPVPQRNQNIRRYGSSLDTPKPPKPASSATAQGDGAVGATRTEATEPANVTTAQDATTKGRAKEPGSENK